MKLKKIVFLTVICGLLMIGCGTQAEQVSNTAQPVGDAQDKEDVNVSVLIDSTVEHSLSEGLIANDCSTYEKMEEQSEIVVYGEKIREFFRKSEVVDGRYELIAEVQIETVIKSNGDFYGSGDRILVCEDITCYPEYNIINHLNGYKVMKKGKKYYLMLAKERPEEQNSAYYIIGGVYGKVPEDEKEEIVFETKEKSLASEEKEKKEKWVARNRKELVRKITSVQSR